MSSAVWVISWVAHLPERTRTGGPNYRIVPDSAGRAQLVLHMLRISVLLPPISTKGQTHSAIFFINDNDWDQLPFFNNFPFFLFFFFFGKGNTF